MKNLRTKAAKSLILSAILFCVPVAGFTANRETAVVVLADGMAEETAEETTALTAGTDKDADSASEELVYAAPNVKITIRTPSACNSETAKVPVKVEDTLETGNFVVQKVEAKVKKDDAWTDITDEMYVEITKDCTVYIRVTDQNGATYTKKRKITCFDYEKPTLNAAVSDGLLTIQAKDADSGVKAIYVNGYEYTEITNGTLNIRLQQFDASYEEFTISAMDNAGNVSEAYITANPYYTDPEDTDSSSSDAAEQLPVSASATAPTSATAQVTEHTTTGTVEDSSADSDSDSEKGKEFYTIQTESGKVFYLIVNRDDETVYFLTEISENDLLNTTTDNSETLPKNSAAVESAIPVSESAIGSSDAENDVEEELTEDETESAYSTETGTEAETETVEKDDTQTQSGGMALYAIMGVAAVLVICGAYVMKSKKKKENFEDDETGGDEDDYEDDYDSDEDEE